MRPKVDYLRISLTDRCQLRCVYCMPPEGIEKVAHKDILTFEEIIRVIRASLGVGITRFRLTGGEPLVRRGVVELVEEMGRLAGIDDLSLTTNGLELPRYARRLRTAGIRRVNISLDSVDSDTYRRITRGGELSRARAGIEAARHAGFDEVKLNAVVLKGINEEDIFSLLEFARRIATPIRFIEMMPISIPEIGGEERFVSVDEIKERIETRMKLDPLGVYPGCGPAEYYQAPGSLTVGFISPISRGFCTLCNRMRLTADGKLRPCLASDRELDLREALRDTSGNLPIREVILRAISLKPSGHDFASKIPSRRKMPAIGG